MTELAGTISQVEQVGKYVTLPELFLGGCVTLLELCLNLYAGTCGTLLELCWNFVATFQAYCFFVGTIAEL